MGKQRVKKVEKKYMKKHLIYSGQEQQGDVNMKAAMKYFQKIY